MSILIICPHRDPTAWKRSLQAAAPDVQIEVYPEIENPEAVELALSWRHPQGVFNQFPNLKVIASMGAGIDHIVKDREIPKSITITRVVDEQLTEDMSIFVLALVLEHVRNLSLHHCSTKWETSTYQRPEELQIGIMGLGVLGIAAAEILRKNGFRVSGWSKSAKDLSKIKTFHGSEQLDEFLKQSNILVCLLPLTSETKDILNKDLFRKLPEDAYLINVARGEHLVEEDLLEVISNGHLSGASLDVFRQEPLPEEHPFRKNGKIKITPHIASVTSAARVAPQIAENYSRMKAGKPLKNVVDREKQY